MTKTDPGPWAHIGEPAAPLAGFGWELPGLPPEQAAMLRSLELEEKREERERQERIAERADASYNRMVAESMSRAHAAGEPWDPANPLKHYPTIDQRIGQAFAMTDAQANAELRQARRAAARVLREHGVHAQVVVDANQPASGHELPPVPVSSPPSGLGPGGPSSAGEAARSRRARVRALLRWAAEHPRDPHPLAHDGREIMTAAGRARRAAEDGT